MTVQKRSNWMVLVTVLAILKKPAKCFWKHLE
jgi:hypothetical protein